MHYRHTQLHRDTVLYSVIPLPLDAAYKEQHLRTLAMEGADVQLLERDDLPSATFKFFQETVAVLISPQARSVSKRDITTAPPFTTLLIGPSCACHLMLQSYSSWAHVDGRIFSMTHSMPYKKKLRSTVRKGKARSCVRMWREYAFPKVWARATFSTVDVPCYRPRVLQDELQRFFSAPISVNGLAPNASFEHSECMAWLYAIYAMSAARLVGRTTLCHYRSINAQYKLWYKNTEGVEKAFPKLWNFALEREKTTAQYRAFDSKNYNPDSVVARKVITKSNFDVKKALYNKTKIHHVIVGFSCVRVPIVMQGSVSEHDAFVYKLSVQKNKNNVLIHVPFVPSIRTLEAIEFMVSRVLKLKINMMHISVRGSKDVSPQVCSSYAVVGNLLLEALRKIKNADKVVSVAMPLTEYAAATEVACVVEYTLSMYSKAISPRRIYVSIDAGYIANKTFVRGNVEYVVQDALKALFGMNVCMRDLPELHTTFMNENTREYTGSIREALRRAVIEATHDAIKSQTQNLSDFPMICASSLVH